MENYFNGNSALEFYDLETQIAYLELAILQFKTRFDEIAPLSKRNRKDALNSENDSLWAGALGHVYEYNDIEEEIKEQIKHLEKVLVSKRLQLDIQPEQEKVAIMS